MDQAETLLQKCLEGYEAGLTPEECLSAWPEERAFLEPLLRQAILGRMALAAQPSPEFREGLQTRLLFAAGREAKAALAASPRPEFREKLHEKLMFVAGRETQKAFGVNPDPSYVQRARNRLRYRAGADAQEALRAVPPPRLPFWANARRRLLEAAANQQHQPAPRLLPLLTRTALSVAVFVLALTLGGVLYLTARPSAHTPNAELASIRQETQQVARQAAAGVPIQADALADLSGRTLALSGKIKADQNLSEQLLPLIKQQQEVVSGVKADLPAPPPALQAAQQQLSQAEAQVHISILGLDQTPVSASLQPTVGPAATLVPQPSPTPVPPTPVGPAPVAGATLATPSQLKVTALPGDTTFGLAWFELSTETARVTVPAGWTLIGIVPNAQGLARLDTPRIRLDGPDGVIVLIDMASGQMDALVGGQALNLREKGVNARTMPVSEVVAKAASVARELSHMIETLALTPPQATPTAVPPVATSTSVPTQTPTAVQPTVTPSPAPTATGPTATPVPAAPTPSLVILP